MQATKLGWVLPLLLEVCSSIACADTSTPAGTASTAQPAIPGDTTNYLSNKIKPPFSVFVQKVAMTTKEKTLSPACVPAFSTLRGIGTLKVGTDIQPTFVVTNVSDNAGCEGAAVVKVDDVVVYSQADINSLPPDRYGFTYGTLLVPYKYHLGGSKSFTGSTTVGGYLGFRQDRTGLTGLDLQYVAFLGATTVPVTQTVSGQSTTQNMSGVSYGLGIIGTVKGAFHMGALIGADRVNSSAGYINNGKPWLAVELGYSFSN